jgi:hypothetical protein
VGRFRSFGRQYAHGKSDAVSRTTEKGLNMHSLLTRLIVPPGRVLGRNLAFTALLVLVGALAPAVVITAVPIASFTDTCFTTATQATSPAFNESTVTRVEEIGGTRTAPTIHVIGDDETGLLLGEGSSVTPLGTTTGSFWKDVANPNLGDAAFSDGTLRPAFPALFITDVTSAGSNATGPQPGDWQSSSGTRQVTDGVTNGTTTFTSATAAFTSGDVGKTITDAAGKHLIPAGDTITALISATQVTLAVKASGSTTADLTTFGFPVTTSGASNLSGATPLADSVNGSWSTATIVNGTYTPVKPTNKNNFDFGPGAVGAPSPPWRQITDGITTGGSTTLKSTNAEFAASDVGQPVGDQNGKLAIPSGTTIAAFVSSTQVTMSNAATSSQTADTVQLGTLPITITKLLGTTGQEGFGTDVGWNALSLKAWDPGTGKYTASLLPGHLYRVQVITHDGDQNKTGGDAGEYCQNLRIPGSPSISTALSPASPVAIGTAVHDTASLTGATSDASGSVTYSYFTDSGCTQNGIVVSTVTVSNGLVPASAPITFSSAGTFYWQAVYTGDANNIGPVSSACTSEQLVVNKNTPAASTAPNLLPNDSATLSGGFSPTGSIIFNLFSPSDADCSSQTGQPAFTQTVSVNGNNPYLTTNTAFLASDPGEWRWQVLYSGDSNNQPISSACGVENFTIVSVGGS